MGEQLIKVATESKDIKYTLLFPQVEGLLTGEEDMIANMANMVAALKEVMGFFWVGFYLVKGEQLVLGPFQGPIACTRIPKGRGVCGVSWEKSETLVVPNVDEFDGHIACSALTKSEIVIPVKRSASVIAVLDVDSARMNEFDEVDRKWLEKFVALLG